VSQLCTGMSVKPAVFVTRSRDAFPAPMLDKLEGECEVSYAVDDTPISREALLHGVQGVEGLLCLLTDKVDKEVIDAADKLKVLATMSVGHDHLDLALLKERGVKVGYTPGVLTAATADMTVSLLLATSRRILEGNAALKAGKWSAWSPLWMCGPELAGSTVGIVGLGQIGRAVMLRLQPFGVSRFLYSGRGRKEEEWEAGATFVPFQQLLKESDFVVVTCSYSPEQLHMFDKAAFDMMKETSVLINTSRGGIINQDDLVTALREGSIFAAGLDVMTPEPLPTDHPLAALDNCVLAPHLGSATLQTRARMMAMTVDNLLAGLRGGQMPAQV